MKYFGDEICNDKKKPTVNYINTLYYYNCLTCINH